MTHITVYALSVSIQTKDHQLSDYIDRFIKSYYTSVGIAHSANQPPKLTEYVSRIGTNTVLMHTNQFVHLLHYLKDNGVSFPSDTTRTDSAPYTPRVMDYAVRTKWELRPDQLDAYNFILDNPVKSKMVSMPTGSGKTATSMMALAKINQLLGITILPTYVEKWVGDIVEIHEATPTDIMVISGSKAVRAVVAMAKDNELTARYFIFSSRTLQDFISAYEEDPEQCVLMYGCSPFELMSLIQIGSLLIDETHQHFHAIFKIILYSNVQFQLGLSATLISDDPVVTRVHRVVYPESQTYNYGAPPKYNDVYALGYYFPEGLLKQVKTTNFGSNSYAHTAFENSILKNKPLLKFYIELITANLEALYLDRYEANDKCLIFVSTVKLATILADLYRKMLPHLVVNRFCEDDPEESHLHGSDIIVSTVISSGTAKDIKDLRVVLQTVCISSAPQNIQNLGRLRKLKGDRDTRFGYLFAENIRKQRMYHQRRIELFAPRVASHRTFKAKMQSTLKLPKT